jgi:uncharacterized membrane protein
MREAEAAVEARASAPDQTSGQNSGTRSAGLLRTTFVGAILFLLPAIFTVFLLNKGIGFAKQLAEPIVQAAGIKSAAGVVVATIVAVAALAGISLLAGLMARTRVGQIAFARLEHSLMTVLPQWRMARGLLDSFEVKEDSEIEVVLVPTDAGWCLGVVLEKPEGDWWSVFVPGSPQWTSGAVVYAHSGQVHHSGLSLSQAIALMRKCGAGSKTVRAVLASLDREGALRGDFEQKPSPMELPRSSC